MNEIDVKTSTDIQSFNPEETVLEIRKYDSAEKHFLKAKNPDDLILAIEKKMKLQRDFVIWWNSEERRGRPEKNGNSTVTLKDLGTYTMEVKRWSQKLSDEEKYELSVETAIEKAIRACEGKGSPFAELHGNKNDDWYTPSQYIEAARKVMGSIDLDPASCHDAQQTVRAKQYYVYKSEDDNGLTKPWSGNVWINPPFSNVLPFAEKLISHLVESGEVTQAIVLTNNNTDTLWWHKMAELATGVCFTKGRISFYDTYGETSAPTNGQTFFYFGDNRHGFVSEFFGYGLILS